MSVDPVLAAAERFSPEGGIVAVQEYGGGNVNDTFLVTLGEAADSRFILQRLNRRVFPQPELVMGNLRTFTRHLQRRQQQELHSSGRRWETPEVRFTRDGSDYWIDPQGSFWRSLSFIEQARSLDSISDLDHAAEVGYALGRFHRLLSDLPPDLLSDTLPGFHLTPGYVRQYDQVLEECRQPRSPEVDFALKFIDRRRAGVSVLEQARNDGRLTPRIIHGDPKVNNVLLDSFTGLAVAMIDLDTVKPGLVQYDIGDCLRSGCNPLGEETADREAVRFEADLCQAILRGYLSQARNFLRPPDYDYLYDAVRLIAFELGLRFFTDYLAGNLYFKARDPEHNLARALVQFKLTESIESQAGIIQTIIRDLR